MSKFRQFQVSYLVLRDLKNQIEKVGREKFKYVPHKSSTYRLVPGENYNCEHLEVTLNEFNDAATFYIQAPLFMKQDLNFDVCAAGLHDLSILIEEETGICLKDAKPLQITCSAFVHTNKKSVVRQLLEGQNRMNYRDDSLVITAHDVSTHIKRTAKRYVVRYDAHYTNVDHVFGQDVTFEKFYYSKFHEVLKKPFDQEIGILGDYNMVNCNGY